jgi:hypothetical protein
MDGLPGELGWKEVGHRGRKKRPGGEEPISKGLGFYFIFQNIFFSF